MRHFASLAWICNKFYDRKMFSRIFVALFVFLFLFCHAVAMPVACVPATARMNKGSRYSVRRDACLCVYCVVHKSASEYGYVGWQVSIPIRWQTIGKRNKLNVCNRILRECHILVPKQTYYLDVMCILHFYCKIKYEKRKRKFDWGNAIIWI